MSQIDSSVDSARSQSRTFRTARWLVLVLLVAFSTGFGAAIGTSILHNDNADATTQLTSMPEFKVLEETYDVIRSHYVLSKDISDEQLLYGASRGMVESLGDTGHSTFLDPQEAKDFANELDSQLIGIGVQVDLTGPMPVVIAPIDGSPAYDAGIKPGDVIVSVDGVESAGRDPQDVTDLIRGKEGTKVTLVLRHRNSNQTYEVTVTRTKITLKPVAYAMLPDNVLWLRIARFSDGTTAGVQEALRWGKQHGMTKVLLDLRNNPGGYTHEAMGVGGQFLPAGSVLYQEQMADGSIAPQTTTTSDGEWSTGEMVVLINGGSASAAEIVASGLRDNGRAKLYGETTVGTGTVLSGYTLSDGSMALIGTKLWLRPNGSDIWKKGVDPDVVVALAPDQLPSLPIEFDSRDLTRQQLDGTDDAQLLAGYDALTGAAVPAATPEATPAA